MLALWADEDAAAPVDKASRWVLTGVLIAAYGSGSILAIRHQTFYNPFFTQLRAYTWSVLFWGSVCLLVACMQVHLFACPLFETDHNLSQTCT